MTRFYLVVITLILIAWIATPVAFLALDIEPGILAEGQWQVVIAGLFLFPLVAGMVALFTIMAHPKSYQFAPHLLHEFDDEVQEKKLDPLMHQAQGAIIAVLQDFSRGEITNPSIYGDEMREMFVTELHQYKVYIDRGFEFHYDFHHEETHKIHSVHQLTANEYIAELDGLFDYYFQRDQERHPTPHGYDKNPPLIRVPALMRVRLQHNADTGLWQVVGFSESIRGVSFGFATR